MNRFSPLLPFCSSARTPLTPLCWGRALQFPLRSFRGPVSGRGLYYLLPLLYRQLPRIRVHSGILRGITLRSTSDLLAVCPSQLLILRRF
ncbi:hypothetical protein M433DRAFT_428711 [Acidomyces richmondensis BFW]|nr:MAG: hypothetical protein FE78DRAFT_234089 [Acidomyces sp. 'richmondensis']KYG42196.1 hypothetical protein M433DRAFT_428711 [Acidomyces richmondensis BFW]